jgi:hypothetical protein
VSGQGKAGQWIEDAAAMGYWWRSRRAGRDLAAFTAAQAAIVLAGTVAIPIPTLAGATTPTPVAVFAPLLVAISVATGLSRRLGLEDVAVRRIRLIDTSWILALAVAGLAVALVASGRQQVGIIAGRDLAGYLGLTMIGCRILGNQASAVLPVGYAIASAMLGYNSGTIASWAWPVAAPHDSAAMALALGTCLAGLVTLARSPVARAVRA